MLTRAVQALRDVLSMRRATAGRSWRGSDYYTALPLALRDVDLVVHAPRWRISATRAGRAPAEILRGSPTHRSRAVTVVASARLEVGSGFHPELTGAGTSSQWAPVNVEIRGTERFDEIFAFSVFERSSIPP